MFLLGRWVLFGRRGGTPMFYVCVASFRGVNAQFVFSTMRSCPEDP